jgi:predicted phosphodiesterase
VSLSHPPLLFAPTADGVSLALTLTGEGDRDRLTAEAWAAGHPAAIEFEPIRSSEDAIVLQVRGLESGTAYEYRVRRGDEELAKGSFSTAREPGAPFTFDVIADTHVFVRDFTPTELSRYPLEDTELIEYRAQKEHAERVLPVVAQNVANDDPDFVVHLGDVIDLHGFGPFNAPPPDPSYVARGFVEYRRLLGNLPSRVPHVLALGNWDGENGDYPASAIESSRSQRRMVLPNPGPTTYPQGGGPHDDYFAWTWGDALLVVLNVMTYTSTPHRLGSDPGVPDDWTLGPAQFRWLEKTLASSNQRWTFLFIHHTVGGAGSDPLEAAYGRGGGLAANVGEQARVHDLMREHGVQVFFYGHDHVFTDMVVDGIHYTLPGRAGTNWLFDPKALGYPRTWPGSGHARVQVEPDRVQVEFVDTDREVLYAFELP